MHSGDAMTDRELESVRRELDRFTSAVEETVAELYEEIRLLREANQ